MMTVNHGKVQQKTVESYQDLLNLTRRDEEIPMVSTVLIYIFEWLVCGH